MPAGLSLRAGRKSLTWHTWTGTDGIIQPGRDAHQLPCAAVPARRSATSARSRPATLPAAAAAAAASPTRVRIIRRTGVPGPERISPTLGAGLKSAVDLVAYGAISDVSRLEHRCSVIPPCDSSCSRRPRSSQETGSGTPHAGCYSRHPNYSSPAHGTSDRAQARDPWRK